MRMVDAVLGHLTVSEGTIRTLEHQPCNHTIYISGHMIIHGDASLPFNSLCDACHLMELLRRRYAVLNRGRWYPVRSYF